MKHSHILSWVLLGAVAAGCSELQPFQDSSSDSRSKSSPKWIDTSANKSTPSSSSDANEGSRQQGAMDAAELDAPDPKLMSMEDAELVRTVYALPTGDPDTSALLLEKISPAEVIQGVDFQYQLHVTNLTSAALDNVFIDERASSNLSIREADPEPTNLDGGRATWDLGTLGADEKIVIQVRAAATEGTEVQGLAEASYSSGLRNRIAVIAPALDLQLEVPAVAATGEDIPLELTVRNTGSGDAKDILVNSTLPAGLMTDSGDQTVAIPVGTLRSGESKTVRILARASKAGEYKASAEASMRHGATIASPERTVLVQEPNLALTVAGPSKAFIGRPSRWTLTLANTGGGDAKDVTVEHEVPDGMTFVNASMTPDVSGSNLSWNVGDVSAGASKTIEMYLQAEEAGAAEVRARVAGDDAAVSGSSKVSLQGVSALQLEIDDLTDPVLVGDSLTYHVKVYNQGSAPGSQVKVSVQLDEGMQLVRAQGPTAGEANGNTIEFAPFKTLGPDETATWRIVVKSVTAGDLRLTASMTSEVLIRPVSDTESTQFYQ